MAGGEEVRLGNNKRIVDMSTIKGGVKRDQLKNDAQRAIFDALNTVKGKSGAGDELLDAREISAAIEMLLEEDKGDNKLAGSDIGRILDRLGLKDQKFNVDGKERKIKKEDLFEVIELLSQSSDAIENSEVIDGKNGERTIKITYKNGASQTINDDGSIENQYTDKEGTKVKTLQDKDKHYISQNKVMSNGNTEDTEFKTVDGKDVAVKVTTISDEGKTKTVDERGDNGLRTKLTVDKAGEDLHSVTDYENGTATKKVAKKGAVEDTFEYDQFGKNPRLKHRVEDLGSDKTRTTDIEYKEDGQVETTTETGGRTAVLTKKNVQLEGGNTALVPTEEVITDGDKKTVRTFQPAQDENGDVGSIVVKEVITEPNTTTTVLYDYQQNLKQETKEYKNGNKTQDIYDMKQNAETGAIEYEKLQQTKVINGKTYQVQYENGCAKGIVVQMGETADSLAARFGCSKKRLIEANPHLKGRFKAGDYINVPGEVPADKAFKGRDTREVAIAKQKQHDAQVKYDKQLRAMGLKNYNGAGRVIEYGGKKYTVIGTKTNRERLLVRDAKGNIYTASHFAKADNPSDTPKILDEGYVYRTDYYDKNVKIPSKVRTVGEGKQAKKYVVAPEEIQAETIKHREFKREVVFDYNGGVHCTKGTMDHGYNSQKVQLISGDWRDYLSAADRYVESKGKDGKYEVGDPTYGVNGVITVRSASGTPYYFSASGEPKQQDTQAVETKSGQAIAQAVMKAGNGAGTDEAAVIRANSQIISPGVLSAVDATMQSQKGKSYDAYLQSEFSNDEVWVLKADWVANNAVTDQAQRNTIIGTNITTYGKNKENMQAGLRACNTRADYDGAMQSAADYNASKGYKAVFNNQNALSTLIYHQMDKDPEDIQAANNALLKSATINYEHPFLTYDEQVRFRAEEGFYFIKAADDRVVFKGSGLADEVEQAIATQNADVIHGIDLLCQEKEMGALEDLSCVERADAQGRGVKGTIETLLCLGGYKADLTPEQNAEMAARYFSMSIDHSEAAQDLLDTPFQSSVTGNTGFSQCARIVHAYESSQRDAAMGNRVFLTKEAYDIFCKKYPNLVKMVDKSKLSFEGASNLSQDKIDANMQLYNQFVRSVDASQSNAYDAVSSGGWLDTFVNDFRSQIGLGVTKADLVRIYQNLNGEGKRKLQLAAEGRLVDASGKHISFEDYLASLGGEKLSENLAAMTENYQTSQEYGKMATVMLVTMPAGMGVGGLIGTGTASVLGLAEGSFAFNAVMATSVGIATGTADYAMNRSNIQTSATGNTIESRSATLNNSVMNGVLTGAGAGVGMATSKLYLGAETAARSVAGHALAYTLDVGADIGAFAGYNKLFNGTTQGWKETMLFSLGGNAFAHFMAAGLGKAANTESNTPVLDRASKPAPTSSNEPKVNKSVADNSSVPVGDFGRQSRTGKPTEKVQAIEAEVKNVAEHSTSGVELATTRREVSAIANRDIRRQHLKTLDEAAQKLPPKERAIYEQQCAEFDRIDAQNILNSRNSLVGEDCPVLERYIDQNAHNSEALAEIEGQLKGKNFGDDNARACYDRVQKHLDKVKAQNEPAMTMDELSELVAQKKAAGKSFSETEAPEVVKLIENCTPEEFAKIDQMITGAVRKNRLVKDALKQRGDAIRAEKAQAPKAEEARKAQEAEEARKAEEARQAQEAEEARKAQEAEEARKAQEAEEARKAQEAEEARKAEEARQADEVHEAQVEQSQAKKTGQLEENEIKPQTIINEANSISSSEIPSNYKPLWNHCKQKIESFMNELSSSLENLNMQSLMKNYESIKNDLKTLVGNVGSATGEKLTKMFAGLEHQFLTIISCGGAAVQHMTSPLFTNKSIRDLIIKTAKYRYTHDIDNGIMRAIIVRKASGTIDPNPSLVRLCKELKTDTPLKLYRKDSLIPFMNTSTSDNMNTIGSLMLEAMESGNVNEVLNILRSGDVTLKFENHMGTSVSKMTNKLVGSRAVEWEINAPAGTEGAYIEALMLNPLSFEGEFLVQAGSKLKITGAEYSNGTWHLKADLIQDGINQTIHTSETSALTTEKAGQAAKLNEEAHNADDVVIKRVDEADKASVSDDVVVDLADEHVGKNPLDNDVNVEVEHAPGEQPHQASEVEQVARKAESDVQQHSNEVPEHEMNAQQKSTWQTFKDQLANVKNMTVEELKSLGSRIVQFAKTAPKSVQAKINPLLDDLKALIKAKSTKPAQNRPEFESEEIVRYNGQEHKVMGYISSGVEGPRYILENGEFVPVNAVEHVSGTPKPAQQTMRDPIAQRTPVADGQSHYYEVNEHGGYKEISSQQYSSSDAPMRVFEHDGTQGGWADPVKKRYEFPTEAIKADEKYTVGYNDVVNGQPKTTDIDVQFHQDGSMTVNLKGRANDNGYIAVYDSQTKKVIRYHGDGDINLRPSAGDKIYFYHDQGGHLAKTLEIPQGGIKPAVSEPVAPKTQNAYPTSDRLISFGEDKPAIKLDDLSDISGVRKTFEKQGFNVQDNGMVNADTGNMLFNRGGERYEIVYENGQPVAMYRNQKAIGGTADFFEFGPKGEIIPRTQSDFEILLAQAKQNTDLARWNNSDPIIAKGTNLSDHDFDVIKQIKKVYKLQDEANMVRALDEIMARIKNGEVPCREMFDNIVKQLGIPEKDLRLSLKYVEDFGSIERMFSKPRVKVEEDIAAGKGKNLERFREKRELFSEDELQARQARKAEEARKEEARKEEARKAEEAREEASKIAEQKREEMRQRFEESEKKAEQEAMKQKQDQIAELRGEEFKDVDLSAIENLDNQIAVLELMKEYKTANKPYDEMKIRSDLLDRGIYDGQKHGPEFEAIRKTLYPKEARYAELQKTYDIIGRQTLEIRDEIIAQIKTMREQGAPISPKIIDELINAHDFIYVHDVSYVYDNPLRKSIMQEPELKAYFDDNYFGLYDNPKYELNVEYLPDAIESVNKIKQDIKNGTPVTSESIQNAIDEVCTINGTSPTTETYGLVQDILRHDESLKIGEDQIKGILGNWYYPD